VMAILESLLMLRQVLGPSVSKVCDLQSFAHFPYKKRDPTLSFNHIDRWRGRGQLQSSFVQFLTSERTFGSGFEVFSPLFDRTCDAILKTNFPTYKTFGFGDFLHLA
jgi:hypothetical protein